MFFRMHEEMSIAANASGNMRRTATSSVFSLRKLLLCTLLVFLLWPHASLEFFQFGGESTDSISKDGAVSNDAAGINEALKKMPKRRPFEKKFKFHKLERIELEDDEMNENENENDGYNEDIADNASNADSAGDVSAVESGQFHDEEELEFMRAHKTHKERRTTATTIPTEKKQQISHKSPKQKQTQKHDNNNNDKPTESFFGELFAGLWGGKSKPQQHPNSNEDTSGEDKHATTAKNSIIDWLKWLGEKSGHWQPPPPPPPPPPAPAFATVKETWLDYLNRWPFNSFFPIGKPEKPIRMPHRNGNVANTIGNSNSADASPAMSQERFESVLNTLPGFVVSPAHVSRHTECRQQLQVFHRQLRGNKLWTLQMLDATGKITSGLLRGNINQFGDFDLCTQVKTLVKVTPEIPLRIRGKYCLAHIEIQTSEPALKVPLHLAQGRGLWNSHLGNPSHFVPRYGVANWGVCLPHLCPAEVVREMIETNLRPYNSSGIEFHVEVDDADCYLRQSKKFTKLLQKDNKFAITCLYIAALLFLGLTSLCYQHWSTIKSYLNNKVKANNTNDAGSTIETTNTETDEFETSPAVAEAIVDAEATISTEEEYITTATADTHLPLKTLLQEIFKCFSPQRTLIELMSRDRYEVQFPIFHVLKLGATFALYVCLKYIMIGHLPISNRDKLVRAIDQPTSILFRAPMLYTDVLLVISGFLGAYQLSEEMEQKSYIQLLKRIALKVSRYLPTLYMVLFFQTCVLPYFGSGPLWTNLIGQNARICEQQMWRNLFSVQNAIDFEETCSPMTIQLALEVQLYILGPLIVWLSYTDADAALFVYGAIHALSVAIRFARTQNEYLSMTLFHGMNVSKFYRTANLLYSSPISRATPYLLGIGAGVLHRTQAGTLEIATKLIPVGWCVVALSVFWCFWSPASGMRMDFIYSSSEAASYAAWCPLVLGLSVVWCIFMFPKADNSVLRFLTTTRPVLFLSRIAYPMQLMVYVVVMYNTASVVEVRKYHMSDLVNFNEIGVIVFFAAVLAFIIDIPSKQIRRLILNRLFIERPQQETEQESSSEAEVTEPEPEEQGEQAECEVTAITVQEEERDWSAKTVATDNASSEEELEVIDQENSESEDMPSGTEINDKEAVAEVEAETETEAEEETDITEEDEIKKRPETPPTKLQTHGTNFSRWRRRISED